MSKKYEQLELGYNEMLRDLWCNAWKYSGMFNSGWSPDRDGFYRYMQALRKHIGMLEKRIEELENARENA